MITRFLSQFAAWPWPLRLTTEAPPAENNAPAVRAMADDLVLMALVARGDHDAFAELFIRHERTARTFALRCTGDADVAQDAVQEAFVTLWTKAPTMRIQNFRAFLYSIISRRVADVYRKTRSMAVADDACDTVADPRPLADAKRQQQDQRTAIDVALSGLPSRQRTVFLLVYSAELSLAEAGESMGVSRKAAESLLARARESLRATLRAHHGDVL